MQDDGRNHWPVDLLASLAQNNYLFIFEQQDASNPQIEVTEPRGRATHIHGTSAWAKGFSPSLHTRKKLGPSLPLALQRQEN